MTPWTPPPPRENVCGSAVESNPLRYNNLPPYISRHWIIPNSHKSTQSRNLVFFLLQLEPISKNGAGGDEQMRTVEGGQRRERAAAVVSPPYWFLEFVFLTPPSFLISHYIVWVSLFLSHLRSLLRIHLEISLYLQLSNEKIYPFCMH